MLHTNPGRLERWLGVATVKEISDSMRDWYGPPIAVADVPGAVYACKGGDFRGGITAGYEVSCYERAYEIVSRIRRGLRVTARNHGAVAYAGFASLAALQANMKAGRMQTLSFDKRSWVGGTADMSVSGWGLSQIAGGASSAAPGGRIPVSSTTGAFSFCNPKSGERTFFAGARVEGDTAMTTLLLYDRLFDVAKTMNSTATEAVTGVPTRYQNTTGGQDDSIDGNFLFAEVGGTALAATAHNWTVCTYKDQADAASTLPSLTGNASGTAWRLDHPVSQWFAPLENGDIGIKALTQMQCSALVATGVISFVIGHPIAFLPVIGGSSSGLGNTVGGFVTQVDAVRSAFNLARVFDNAALTLLCPNKRTTSTIAFGGGIDLVAG